MLKAVEHKPERPCKLASPNVVILLTAWVSYSPGPKDQGIKESEVLATKARPGPGAVHGYGIPIYLPENVRYLLFNSYYYYHY